jgi:hypothetical protein
MKPTKEMKATALLHATVWENTFHECQQQANHRQDIDRNTMVTLASFALVVGGEYRKIAYGSEVAD